jgi:LysM repeat protein
MKIQILAILLVLGSFSVTHAQKTGLYFFYDPSCIQKFDYERVGTFHDLAYTDYYLSVSNDKKVIFRVQKNQNYLSRTLVDEIPVKPYMCEDRTQITDDIIAAINQSTKVAYMVVEFGNQYALYEIHSVSAFTENANLVQYKDAKLGFEYQTNNADRGKVLNPTDNKDRNIYFEVAGKSNCANLYTFKSVSNHPEDAVAYINVLSGLGVQRIYTEQGEMQLRSINDMPLNDFMDRRCTALTAKKTGDNLAVTHRTIKDTVGMTAIEKTLWESKQKGSGTVITAGTTTFSTISTVDADLSKKDTLAGGYYLVKQKESLYVISNKFGVSVHRLAEINNLQSFALGLNQRLKVVDDNTVPAQKRSPVVKKDDTGKTQITVHIVEQGQTLYAISKLYGLDLADLYKLNQGLQDRIDINQELVVGVQKI